MSLALGFSAVICAFFLGCAVAIHPTTCPPPLSPSARRHLAWNSVLLGVVTFGVVILIEVLSAAVRP